MTQPATADLSPNAREEAIRAVQERNQPPFYGFRPEVLSYLCCPVCKGDLTLSQNPPPTRIEDGEGIVNGGLWCVPCANYYRIVIGIPLLIDPKLWEKQTERHDG